MSDPYAVDLGLDDDEIDITEDEPEDELDEAVEDDQETDEVPEQDDEPAPARQPSRADNRVREATRIAAEAKRELEQAKAELAAARQSAQAPQESQAQRTERLNQMEPWERTEYLTNERLARIEWTANERADKMSFDMLCSREPAAAKLKDEVESELAKLRAAGSNVDRETMYTHILGRRARANAGRATGRALKTATANRDRQAARPGQSRSDAAPSNQRGATTASARDKRLENMNL